MTPNTDAPDAYSPNAYKNDADKYPDADDNDANYPKSIHLSLRNCNWNRKIFPNTQKIIKRTLPPTLMPPTPMPPNTAYDYASYHYSFINRNNNK